MVVKQQLSIFFISCAIAFFIFAAHSAGIYRTWHLFFIDALYTPHPAHDKIVLILVDEKSIEKIGRWPWKRSIHAELLKKLGNAPAVIGLDIAFSQPTTVEEDTALANQIQENAPVVLPIKAGVLHSEENAIIASELIYPHASVGKYADNGIINVLSDQDGVVRRAPIRIVSQEKKPLDSFALALIRNYYTHSFQHLDTAISDLNAIQADQGSLYIDYSGKPMSFPSYSYSDVLEGQVDTSIFTDKIVIIGVSVPGLYDKYSTPFASSRAMSGSEIHANIVQTILNERYLHQESSFSVLLTLLAVTFLTTFLIATLRLSMGVLLSVILFFSLIVYDIISFDRGVIRFVAVPLIGLLVAFIIALLNKYYLTNKRKQFITSAFLHYVARPVAKQILRDPSKLRVGFEKAEVTVLFSDIAGFSSFAEILPPEKVAALLNPYLARMTDIIHDHRGVLEGYIGDAVMAWWGHPEPEPDHTLLACQTALAMQDAIKEIKKDWEQVSDLDFYVRIGICTGNVAVGNRGSNDRFAYAITGDTVNLGARLEGLNKQYGTRILLSESSYDYVKDRVVARKLDTVAVKGKHKSVTIYELRSLGKPNKTEQLFLSRFEKMRAEYEKGNFKDALHLCNHFVRLYPEDPAGKTYKVRCKELTKNPPVQWDGVFRPTEK